MTHYNPLEVIVAFIRFIPIFYRAWRWSRALAAPLHTAFWYEHPDGYDEPCACDDCKECAQ
jgi:hypothetical protein